jgi:hypothetical protein
MKEMRSELLTLFDVLHLQRVSFPCLRVVELLFGGFSFLVAFFSALTSIPPFVLSGSCGRMMRRRSSTDNLPQNGRSEIQYYRQRRTSSDGGLNAKHGSWSSFRLFRMKFGQRFFLCLITLQERVQVKAVKSSRNW